MLCPADAIKKGDDGIVQSSLKPRCIGCSNCVLACPFGIALVRIARNRSEKARGNGGEKRGMRCCATRGFRGLATQEAGRTSKKSQSTKIQRFAPRLNVSNTNFRDSLSDKFQAT